MFFCLFSHSHSHSHSFSHLDENIAPIWRGNDDLVVVIVFIWRYFCYLLLVYKRCVLSRRRQETISRNYKFHLWKRRFNYKCNNMVRCFFVTIHYCKAALKMKHSHSHYRGGKKYIWLGNRIPCRERFGITINVTLACLFAIIKINKLD